MIRNWEREWLLVFTLQSAHGIVTRGGGSDVLDNKKSASRGNLSRRSNYEVNWVILRRKTDKKADRVKAS